MKFSILALASLAAALPALPVGTEKPEDLGKGLAMAHKGMDTAFAAVGAVLNEIFHPSDAPTTPAATPATTPTAIDTATPTPTGTDAAASPPPLLPPAALEGVRGMLQPLLNVVDAAAGHSSGATNARARSGLSYKRRAVRMSRNTGAAQNSTTAGSNAKHGN